jgi:hypothetical protein
MSYGFNVWKSWHIENCAIYMFKWASWWKCVKTFWHLKILKDYNTLEKLFTKANHYPNCLQILCFILKNDDNLKSNPKMLILKSWIWCNINYKFVQYIMYIIPHFYVVKHFWSFEILNFQMYIFWIFKVLKFHIFKIVNFF